MLQQDVQMAMGGGDQAEEQREFPFEMIDALEYIFKYLDFNSVLRCRLVSKVWEEEANRAIKIGAMKVPSWIVWESERKSLDNEEIDTMFRNLRIPPLFTTAYVSTSSSLMQNIAIFQNHGTLITKLKIDASNVRLGYLPMNSTLWNLMFLHLPNVEEAEFFFPSNFIGRKTLDQMNKLGRHLVVSQMNNTDRSLSRLRKLTFGGFFFCLLPDFTRHLPSYAPNLENLQFDFRVPVPRPNAENLPIQVLIPSVNVPLVENLPPMQNLEPLQNLGGLILPNFASNLNNVHLYVYNTILGALKKDPRAGNPRVKFTVPDDQNRFEIMNPEFQLQDVGNPNVPAPCLFYFGENFAVDLSFDFDSARQINDDDIWNDLPRI